MGINIIYALHDRFGKHRAFFLQSHFPGKILCHNMMKVCNLLLGSAGVHFQNIKVTEAVGLFRFHSAVNAVSGEHGCSNYKVVFKIGNRISGKYARSFQMSKRICIAVLENCFHVTGFHSCIKGIFNRRRTVLGLQFVFFKFGIIPVFRHCHVKPSRIEINVSFFYIMTRI